MIPCLSRRSGACSALSAPVSTCVIVRADYLHRNRNSTVETPGIVVIIPYVSNKMTHTYVLLSSPPARESANIGRNEFRANTKNACRRTYLQNQISISKKG